jgi:aryl-alcohol dehydrogenase-like predicted oxidoreductase
METRELGKSKVKISPIVLGTWAIGGDMWGGTNEADSIAAIQAAIDHGITTIDTAPGYGFGLSEEIVGKAIKGRRNKVVIATKCGIRWKGDEKGIVEQPVNVYKNSKPQGIFFEVEKSLKRLNVDVIDLYQIHWPDPDTPIEESWKAMAKLVEQGKVRAVGVSNYDYTQLKTAQNIFPVASTQMPYSLIRRGIEQDILPFCREKQIGVLAYSSLERGLLTGKVTPGRHFAKGDHREGNPTFSEANRVKALEILEKVKPIAEKHKATLSQIIINVTMNSPGITGALVGVRNPAQAKENADAGRLKLTPDEIKFVRDAFSDKSIQQPLNS